MGLRAWLRNLGSKNPEHSESLGSTPHSQSAAARTGEAPAPISAHTGEIAPGYPADEWEQLPAFLPVDPAEHRVACVIAAALAAGDAPESSFALKHLSIANPEYRRVACIATALGAGALEKSTFVVKNIYKQKTVL